jgi:thyroxine 5-deiodinase
MKEIFHLYCNHSDREREEDSFNKAVARFLTIYIEEAHAHDEWWVPHAKACIRNHRCIEERQAAGKRFVEDFKFPIELVCDSFDNQVEERFDAYPERLYIIEQGNVVYQGEPGPMGYHLSEVKEWLAKRFGERTMAK